VALKADPHSPRRLPSPDFKMGSVHISPRRDRAAEHIEPFEAYGHDEGPDQSPPGEISEYQTRGQESCGSRTPAGPLA
jgi:hypothetical protein